MIPTCMLSTQADPLDSSKHGTAELGGDRLFNDRSACKMIVVSQPVP